MLLEEGERYLQQLHVKAAQESVLLQHAFLGGQPCYPIAL